MNRLQELQDRDAAIVKLMAEINDKVAAENRLELSAEESTRYDGLKSEHELLAKPIAREEEILNAQKELLKRSAGTVVIGKENLEDKKPKIVLPVSASNLQSFKGADAKLNAYTSGQYLLAKFMKNEKAIQFCNDHGVQLAQSEGVNSAGGYLVPAPMEQAIIDLRQEYGVFRREARVLTMSSETLDVNRYVSGLTPYFVGEGTAITDSTKAFDQVRLSAKKLGCLTYWSSEVNEDALINWVDDLTREMAYAFALKEDQCGFIGDGTSTYGGIEGIQVKIAAATASVSTAATSHDSFEDLTLSDFNAVVGLLPMYPGIQPKWYISMPGFASSMQRLAYAAGGNDANNIAGGYGLTFMGYPVVISQVLNSTLGTDASKIKVLFGDLRLAASFGDRRGVTVLTSSEVRFTQDQLAIKATERFDIIIHDIGDTSVAGPVVALKTAA